MILKSILQTRFNNQCICWNYTTYSHLEFYMNQAWSFTPMTPACRRWEQKNHKFKDSLSYMWEPFSNQSKQTNNFILNVHLLIDFGSQPLNLDSLFQATWYIIPQEGLWLLSSILMTSIKCILSHDCSLPGSCNVFTRKHAVYYMVACVTLQLD